MKHGRLCEYLAHRAAITALAVLPFTHAFSVDPRDFLPEAFNNPPPSSRVETWWHWMDGHISKEGLARDLDSMKAQGIQRATITLVGFGAGDATSVAIGTPEFSDLIRFAAHEAKIRGITLGLTAGPGWSGAGGPWIPVEQSMKRVVFSSLTIDGGKEISVSLPPLPASANWSRDTFVLAWPDSRSATRMAAASQLLNENSSVSPDVLFDANPSTGIASTAPRESKTWQMAFQFPAVHQSERAFLSLKSSIWMKGQPVTIRIKADGRTLAEKEMQISDLDAPFYLTFAPVSAQNYKLEIRLPDNSTFGANQFSAQEVEFLKADESPQWTSEFRDLGSQISDAAGTLDIPAKASSLPSRSSIPQNTILDLTSLRSDDTLRWNAPAGRWRIVRFGYTTTNQKIQPAPPGGGGWESDKMSASATELQYRSYIAPLLDAAGDENRSAFQLLTADSWESGMQNWCADFPEQFRARRGYDLTLWMPTLAGVTVGSPEETLRFFNDFRETISDLIIQNYYGKLRELAHADSLIFAAEFAFAGPRLDAFQMTRALDIPMEELWSDWKDGNPPAIPDGAITPTVFANAAQVSGKTIFGYELYTSLRGDWRRMPGDFSFVGDMALLKGMNQASLHSMMHQPDERKPGLTLQGFGQHFQRHNTWWTLARDWLTELTRKQYIFQNSAAFHDILVYYGDTLPRSEINLSKFSLPENAQPLFIDHDTLMNRVSVKDGMLQLDHQGSYACLILPGSTMFSHGCALRVDTLARISELVKAGAILAGQPPLRTPGLLNFREGDALLAQLVATLWGDLPEDGIVPHRVDRGQVFRTNRIADILAQSGYQPALRSTPPDGKLNLKFSRLLAKNAEAYFLFNPNEAPTLFRCDVADSAGCLPERWNPVDGSVEPIPVFQHKDGRTEFSTEIPGKSSIFIVFRKAASPHWISMESNVSGWLGLSFRETSSNYWSATSESAAKVKLGATDGKSTTLDFPAPRILPVVHPWQLRFEQLPGKPLVTMDTPISWTELPHEKLRNYSGLVVFENTLDVPETFLLGAGRVILDLGEVSRACRISINGRNAGTLWRAPWRLPITGLLKDGKNSITIEVVNSWYNRIVADQALPISERTTWTSWPRIKDWLAEKAPAEKSGLLAPARLIAYPGVAIPDSL